jgi:phytoene dehydrogenase-like protein
MRGDADAVVVGSGPNGPAAAVTLSAAGLRVLVIEGSPTIGGGCRTGELTRPGFRHDVCSAAHPLAVASPFFRRFDLAARGVRFAPGFRDLILARHTLTATDEETQNPNYIGGDIAAGLQDIRQTVFRPAARWNPYRIPVPGLYLCSSSTPPLPGVHGRCGELAALTALRDVFGVRHPPGLGPPRPRPVAQAGLGS